MKRFALATSLTLGLSANVAAQESVASDSLDLADSPKISTVDSLPDHKKNPGKIVLFAESQGTDPRGVMVNNQPGYFFSAGGKAFKNTEVLFGAYHFHDPEKGTFPFFKVQQNFQTKDKKFGGNLEFRNFIPLEGQTSSGFFKGKIGTKNMQLEGGHWNFWNGTAQHWVGAMVKKTLGTGEKAFDASARVLAILDNASSDPRVVGEGKVKKFLGNGWNVHAVGQIAGEKGKKPQFNIGFRVGKTINTSGKKK